MSPPPRWTASATAATALLVAGSLSLLIARGEPTKPDPNSPGLVARGRVIYADHCASCHGANLEGQPNWRTRLANGRLPAPPHDATGRACGTTPTGNFRDDQAAPPG